MFVFNFLLGVLLSVAEPDSDGWFPVEKVPKAEEIMTDLDPNIWVLFLKKLGENLLSVRFPAEPIYRTTEDGFIARSTKGGEIFELTVQKGDAEPGDRLYELDGKWVHEHTVRSGELTYKLRTYSLLPEAPNHAEFVASFSI